MSDINEVLRRGMHAQLGRWRAATGAGERRLGWKIGFNDPAARARLGLPHALLGYLTEATRVASGDRFAAAPDASILLEGELGLRVDGDVPAGSSATEARAAIAECAAAIELVDMSAGVADFHAVLEGNIFHRAVAFGPTHLGLPWPRNTDVHMAAGVDGQTVGEGEPQTRLPEDLGDLVRLTADLLAAHGEGLRAGDWIISGSVIPPVALRPGQQAKVTIQGLEPVSIKLA